MTTTFATFTAAAATPVELDLEARLALRDAEMVGRCQLAATAVDVNTAHLPGSELDLVDYVTAPITLPTVAPDPPLTPVAALLQRARARIVRDGWCRDAARTDGGAMCLTEAIRAEARNHAEEGEARLLLRQTLGGGDPIPEQNRRLASAAHAAHMLTQTANAAAERGI